MRPGEILANSGRREGKKAFWEGSHEKGGRGGGRRPLSIQLLEKGGRGRGDLLGKRGLIWRRWETAIVTGPIISRRKSLSDAAFHKPNLTPPSSAAAIYRAPLWSPPAAIMCPEGGCILCTSVFYSPKRGKAAYTRKPRRRFQSRDFFRFPLLYSRALSDRPFRLVHRATREGKRNGMEFNFGIPSLPSPSSNPFQLHERVAWYGRSKRREGRRTNSKRYLPPLPSLLRMGGGTHTIGMGASSSSCLLSNLRTTPRGPLQTQTDPPPP